MFQKAKELAVAFWTDEDGAHIVEYIIGVVLLGAAAAAVGLGVMSTGRAKTGEIMEDINGFQATAAGNQSIKETEAYTYTTSGTDNLTIPNKFTPTP